MEQSTAIFSTFQTGSSKLFRQDFNHIRSAPFGRYEHWRSVCKQNPQILIYVSIENSNFIVYLRCLICWDWREAYEGI